MSLHVQIKERMKEALKSKDAIRLSVLRNIMSACTNELVATGGTPQDVLSDELTMSVITRLAKQRKDSIDQFTKGGRPELADQETKELDVLQEFLPTLMSLDEILPIAEAKKNELGITDPSKKGMLIGALMKELTGRADGGDVKKAVEQLLS